MANAPVPGLAAGAKAQDVFMLSYTCQSTSLVYGTAACNLTSGTDMDVTDPDNANAGPVLGLVASQGTLSAGAFAAPTAGDAIDVQRFGRAVGLLDINQTIARGDKIGVVAGTGGRLGAFLPGGGMKFVGTAAQSKTSGATALYFEVDLALPHPTQAVRQVTVSQPLKTTVLGAATVFGATTGLAFGTAAIQLYRARFAGEIIRNLSVSLGIAPGGADTVVVTIQTSTDNGNTWTDRAVTCTVTGAAFSATDLTHSYSMAAGEIMAIKAVSSAGTAAGACITVDIVK